MTEVTIPRHVPLPRITCRARDPLDAPRETKGTHMTMIRKARHWMFLAMATALCAVALTLTASSDAMAGTAKYRCPVGSMSAAECKATYDRFARNGVRVWGYHRPYCTQYYCYDGGFYYFR